MDIVRIQKAQKEFADAHRGTDWNKVARETYRKAAAIVDAGKGVGQDETPLGGELWKARATLDAIGRFTGRASVSNHDAAMIAAHADDFGIAY